MNGLPVSSAAGYDPAEGRRDDLVQLGVWMFLGTVVMLFAAFTSAYIVRRSASDWTPVRWPGVLWVNTWVLVLSSGALEWGRHAMRRGLRARARRRLAAAAALGILFLAGQMSAWRTLAGRGVYVPTSPHGSFFYVLTAAHAAHVIAGVALLVVAAARFGGRGALLERAGSARLVEASATFWHFLAVLWLYVFALVSAI